MEQMEEKHYKLYGGSGYGHHGWKVGQTIRINTSRPAYENFPEYVTVVKAKAQYIDEDGLSFGVGDEEGYIYTALCREATPEEIAPVKAKSEHSEKQKQMKEELKQIRKKIQDRGDMPPGPISLKGKKLFDTRNIHGGGDWFVITDTDVWYVLNNGMDGDDWSRNNIRTGGAGAIGWKLSREGAGNIIAERLYKLSDQIEI